MVGRSHVKLRGGPSACVKQPLTPVIAADLHLDAGEGAGSLGGCVSFPCGGNAPAWPKSDWYLHECQVEKSAVC